MPACWRPKEAAAHAGLTEQEQSVPSVDTTCQAAQRPSQHQSHPAPASCLDTLLSASYAPSPSPPAHLTLAPGQSFLISAVASMKSTA